VGRKEKADPEGHWRITLCSGCRRKKIWWSSEIGWGQGCIEKDDLLIFWRWHM